MGRSPPKNNIGPAQTRYKPSALLQFRNLPLPLTLLSLACFCKCSAIPLQTIIHFQQLLQGAVFLSALHHPHHQVRTKASGLHTEKVECVSVGVGVGVSVGMGLGVGVGVGIGVNVGESVCVWVRIPNHMRGRMSAFTHAFGWVCQG